MPSSSEALPNDKLQVAWTSVFVTLFLIVAKLVIGLSTGSLAILSQAADSGFDLIAVLITLLAVRVSSIPPDTDHLYGHGKFESLSALGQSILLFGITVWIAVEALHNLLSTAVRPVEVNAWSFGVLIVSIGLDLWRARLLQRAGREHNSHALEASALNFFTDILSAIIALIGLALVHFAHLQNADNWAALGLAVFVAVLSIRLGKRAVDGLTDRFSSPQEYERLKTIVKNTPGIEGISRLRIRQAGPSFFVEASVQINRILPFAAIEKIVQDVEAAITEAFPSADVTVHWKPVRTEIEAPFETLKVIVAEYGILPHNIELSQSANGEISLDYHLEFRPGTKLADADALSKLIEGRIRAELPQVSQIFVHLEEERSDRRLPSVRDITSAQTERVSEIAVCARSANHLVKDVRRIHLLESTDIQHLKLMLTVDVNSSLSLGAAHDVVTRVEEALRKRFPELDRIVIHANPIAVE